MFDLEQGDLDLSRHALEDLGVFRRRHGPRTQLGRRSHARLRWRRFRVRRWHRHGDALDVVNSVDTEYRKRIAAMTIAERVQRAEDMLAWARGFMARQIVAERGPLRAERLKWEVALRQYGADPITRSLIEGIRARVSD